MAVTPVDYDEGVDAATGDTWTQTTSSAGGAWTGAGANRTRAYTNVAGQAYKTEQATAAGTPPPARRRRPRPCST